MQWLVQWKALEESPGIKRCIIGLTLFWGVCTAFLLALPTLGSRSLGLTDPVTQNHLIIALSIGIGLGTFFAGRVSRGAIELGLIPLSLCTWTIACLGLACIGLIFNPGSKLLTEFLAVAGRVLSGDVCSSTQRLLAKVGRLGEPCPNHCFSNVVTIGGMIAASVIVGLFQGCCMLILVVVLVPRTAARRGRLHRHSMGLA